MQFVKLGATALAGVFLAFATASAPAFAQNGQTAAPPPLTRQMVQPMNEARNAIIAKDWPTATAKLQAAAAQAKTPVDRAQLDRLRIAMYAETGDNAALLTAMTNLIASNTLTPDELKQYKGALIKTYADVGDTAKSLAASREYIDTYGGPHEMIAALANDFARANDNAASLIYIDKAIAAARTAGAKPPEAYYRLKARAVNAAGDKTGYFKVIETLVAEYPNDNYWKELILRVQNEPNYDAPARLDMYRTLVAAGVKLSAQEKSNLGREAIRRGLPQEALDILDTAIASGELGANAEDKENLAIAKRRVGEDKPGLARETQEIIAEGDASAMASIGEAHLSYGDHARAAEVLKAAIDKGISNPGEADLARLHLGIAQYRLGDKAAAQGTWGAIKADNGAAVLAQNWIVISNVK